MGWALGMAICGLILRQGMGAEGLAWTVVFTISPISAVYYPVSILPGWLQHVSWVLPSTYVFEGMRAVLFSETFRVDYLLTAVALDLVYVALRCGRVSLCLPRRPPARRAIADGRVRENGPAQLGPLTPASANVAMPLWQATAAFSTAKASVAPEASPSRMPRSRSGRWPIRSSSRR